MAETIVLDPSAVATNRTQLDISAYISAEGVDWGQAAIDAYIADGQVGSSPVDFRLPNRPVVIPLKLVARGAVTFETIRRQLQAKVALFQREGGWLSRTTAAGTVYADVATASLRLGGDWLQANRGVDVNAELSLELVPDWYRAEVTLDDKTEITALALTTVLKLSASDAVIAGDYPGRVRFVVDEDQGQTQLGLIWGIRSRYYDSAATAALTYQAEALTPLDMAATATVTGASGAGANVVQHTSIRTDWTAVLSTQIVSGGAQMTHRGTYRVWARCYSTSATPPAVRLIWSVGELVTPSENTRKSIPGPSNFYWLDLGEIRLAAAPSGTHHWRGQIEAIGSAGGENVSVDAVHFVPVDDGYGVLRAPQILRTPTAFAGRDEFTGTTAGNALGTRTAPAGGSWATSGDATDFTFSDDVGETLKRSTVSGTNGRFAILGTTNFAGVITSCVVRMEAGALSGFPQGGAIARWVDSSNHLRAVIYRDSGTTGFPAYLEIHQLIGGVKAVLAQATTTSLTGGAFQGTAWTIQLSVTAAGFVTAQMIASGSSGLGGSEAARGTVALTANASLSSSAMTTLATGKIGIFDLHTGSTAGLDRYYDDFRVAAIPTLDATLYPNQSAELRTDGIYRANPGGGSYASAPHIGDLPRLPPSGLENRKVEIYINASRGDFDQIPDTGIDDISAQGFYRASYLYVPGS